MRSASTVLLLRDRPDLGFEVFMVRRHQRSGFMADAYVFPGGTLDDGDRQDTWIPLVSGLTPSARTRLGEDTGADDIDEATARGLFVAAVRETLEEAGVLIGADLEASHVQRLRTALEHGEDLSALLAQDNQKLDLAQLVPLARWITPEQEPRRYDTRFFLARTHEQPSHDGTETTDHAWWSPGEALAAQAKGAIKLPPPTARTLLDLKRFRDTEHVLTSARERRPPCVQPVVRQLADQLVIALPGDSLHSTATPAFEGPTRLVLENGRWWAR